MLLLSGCERVPVYAVQLTGSSLAPIVEYRRDDRSDRPDWDQHWGIRDDWHRLFVKLRAYPDGIGLYVRALDNTDSPSFGYWFGPVGRPLLVTPVTSCPSTIQYFNKTGNAQLYNFDKPGYPDIYPYAPETSAPDAAAILKISQCEDAPVSIRIQVLDSAGVVARDYEFALEREEIDWYYDIPLFK